MEKPKVSYIFGKTLILSVIWSKCKNEDETIFKKGRISWNIRYSWFDWKSIITFKIWQKKT